MKTKIKLALIGACTIGSGMLMGFDLGKSGDTIYYGNGQKHVATEFSSTLNNIFGCSYFVKPYTINYANSSGIFVGIVPQGVAVNVERDREFIACYVHGEQLFLWGRDEKNLKGSAFAVYDFLEKVCNVRYLWPGKLGTIISKMPPVKLYNGLKYYVPPFCTRLTSSFTYGMNLLPPESKKALQSYLNHGKVGSSIGTIGSGFQHAFGKLMPRKVYGKTHPEYYSLVSPANWIGEPKPINPTRTNDPTRQCSWQLCTSNPEVRRIIAEKLAAADTDKIQSISPNDGFGFCECENCLKEDLPLMPSAHGKWPNLTNRMFRFLKDVASQAKKLNPKTRVGLFSYSFFDGVPTADIGSMPDNVFMSLCYQAINNYDPTYEKRVAHQINGLSKLGINIVGREYWGTHYYLGLPVSHSRKIDENIKLLNQAKATGIYGETGKCFATRATDLYILRTLAWNPELKREDILQDFCDKAFGKAASVMFDYFEWVENYHVSNRTKYYKQPKSNPIRESYPNLYAERLRTFVEDYGPAFYHEAQKKLKAARKLAETSEQMARIDYFILGIDYTKVMVKSISAIMEMAAAGVNMPLIQPAEKMIQMEKNNLLSVARNLVRAENSRMAFAQRHQGDFASFSPFSSNSISLRPWLTLGEIAVLDILSGNYNYLVNGAFEYGSYSWEIKPLNGKSIWEYSNKNNHDAVNNYMVQCHVNQGISLKITLEPGAKVAIKQCRPIESKSNAHAKFSCFLRTVGKPLPFIEQISCGNSQLKPHWVNETMVENHWHEIRTPAEKLNIGKNMFSLTLFNPTGKTVELWLDDLRLMIQ